MACAKTVYQSRFLAYCRAQGRRPKDQLAHDSEAFPGGKMCGFVLWVCARWAEWKKQSGWPCGTGRDVVLGPDDHRAFDLWLEQNLGKK